MIKRAHQSLTRTAIQEKQQIRHRCVAKRLPSLNINTELPKDLSTVPTHELFVKTGFFLHPKPGLVHWMPLGFKILKNVEGIIRRNMENAGGEEVSLSLLSLGALWQQTGRWENSELFKLYDSKDDPYCLAATCEEEITAVVKQNLKLYRQLPQLFFQINKKYRDEMRPRSGLLRGREFIMKDAYSFDATEEQALEAYDGMVSAYVSIFDELKIPYVKALADTGEIGGSLSHEWHYLHSSAGEDTLFTCVECGHSSNVEKTLSFPTEPELSADVLVRYYASKDRSTLICAYFPSKRTLQEELLKIHVSDIDLGSGKASTEASDLLAEFSNEDDLSKRVIRVMDARLDHTLKLPDFPIPFINRSFISTMFDSPIVSAEEGEFCGECEEGLLTMHRSIEVGHTFYLGDKYSKALALNIVGPGNEKQPVLMGCYGIGVSRIIAAMGEILRDEGGFRWPKAVAPWKATVVVAGKQKADDEKFSEVYQQLKNLEFKVDDRDKPLGAKIQESRIIGIPFSVIVGKQMPQVSIEVRGIIEGNEEGWRKLFEEKNKEYKWTVEGNKHVVDVKGLGPVMEAIMADMK